MKIILSIKDSATLSRIEDLDKALRGLSIVVVGTGKPFSDVIENIGKEW